MHRFSRSAGALTALAAVGVLTMAGCGSGSKSAGGGGSTTRSTAGTSGDPAPTTQTNQTAPTTQPDQTGQTSQTAPASGTAASSAASAASSSSGAADRPQCPGLVEKLVPLPGAASGNTFSDLVATNDGTAACTLPAQPKLEYLDAGHQTLVTTATSDPTAKPYNLAPGASAAMVVGYGTDGTNPCVAIAFVRVAPSGDVLPYSGRRHCAHDEYYEEGWVAGTYSAPH